MIISAFCDFSLKVTPFYPMYMLTYVRVCVCACVIVMTARILKADYPTVEEALTNPDVPRIMLVRNPYARLLSGYKNKLELLRMFR